MVTLSWKGVVDMAVTYAFVNHFKDVAAIDKSKTTLVQDKANPEKDPSYFSEHYFYLESGVNKHISTHTLTLRQMMFFCSEKGYNFSTAELGYSSQAILEGAILASSVSVTPTSINPTEGQTGNITATVAPANTTDKTVTFSSSAPTIITVDNTGKWTAVKAGTATITASTSNNKTATVSATVQAKVIPVTGVTVTPTSINPTEGETATITATVAPSDATNKTVTFSSSDNAIVTVDNTGKWVAVKAGTATITAKTTDGSKTATTSVTVKAPIVLASSVTASPTELKDIAIGAKGKITPTVLPANTTDKTVTFTSDKPAVVTVDSAGNYEAKAEGSAVITLKTANNKTATVAVTVVPTQTP